MAGTPGPSSHELPHQLKQRPVTLIYQWENRKREGWEQMHNPKAKQSQWLPGNAVVSTYMELMQADGACATKLTADQALLGQYSDK